MKKALLFFAFYFVGMLLLPAQNLFVIRVNGKIKADDKVLKRRDRIKTNAKLVFDSPKDEIHLYGSSGHFHVRGANATPTDADELIMELEKMLMPAISFTAPPTHSMDPIKEFEYEIPWYSTLLSPHTSFQAADNTSYFLQFSEGDTPKKVDLSLQNGKVSIDKNSFPANPATDQVFSIIAKDDTGTEKELFRIANPKWMEEKEVIEQLENLISKKNISGEFELLQKAKEHFYNNGQIMPDEVFNPLIEKHIQWYDYYVPYTFATLTHPTYIATDSDFLKYNGNGTYHLVRIANGTATAISLKQREKWVMIKKKHFKKLGYIEGTAQNNVTYALAFQKEGLTGVDNMQGVYYFQPKDFVLLSLLKKDLKVMREIGVTDKSKALEIIGKILNAKYETDSYIEDSLEYLWRD